MSQSGAAVPVKLRITKAVVHIEPETVRSESNWQTENSRLEVIPAGSDNSVGDSAPGGDSVERQMQERWQFYLRWQGAGNSAGITREPLCRVCGKCVCYVDGDLTLRTSSGQKFFGAQQGALQSVGVDNNISNMS